MADRIRGGYSRHDEHKPELCTGIGCGASWTCVDCCKQEADRDVIECAICGRQKSVSCSFDEDFS